MNDRLKKALPNLAIAAAFLGAGALCVYIALEGRTQRLIQHCQENLVKLDGMKEQFRLENNKLSGDEVKWPDLIDNDWRDRHGPPWPWKCPVTGQEYILNPIGTHPVCPSGLPGHSISDLGDPATKSSDDDSRDAD